MAEFSVRNLTRRKTPVFAFKKAHAQVLPSFDISLAFIDETRAKKLNKALRKKSYTPNVLAYPTGKKSGEVLICLPVAREQAPSYGMSYPIFVGYLFIHALLHLKGSRHGSTMEKAEREVLARLAHHYIYGSSNRRRHRHRHVPNKGRHR